MIDRNRIRVSRLTLGLLAALAAAPAFAQSTSASLGGRVVADDGQPVANAEVLIVHTPSGTVSRTTTDSSGRYVSRGLRVGGPYTITVQAPGFQSTAQEDIYAQLAETSTVNISLATESATTLEAITVVGTSVSDIFGSDRIGAGTNVNQQQLNALPSIGRNIQDYARLDPRISQTDKQRGEISVGGQNTRFNAIRIDGVSTNDPFGLEANNLPTLRQPVSLDAIEEVQIAVADYDVTITGATGAVINAVTRSGTNDFSGSVYGVYRDNSYLRKNTNGDRFGGFKDEQTYGFTLGGPLLRDRLFFFVNYEDFTRRAPGPSFGPVGSGASNIVNLTPAQLAEIQDVAQSVWGFSAGNLDVPENLETNVEEYAIKLDWNISDDHRASLRYSRTEQVDAILPGFGGTSLSFNSYWYDQVKTFESLVGQVYSDWSPNFSTEFKASWRTYDSVAEPFSRLPSIRVNVAGSTGVNLGTERFRHINVLETEELSLFGAGYLYLGDHELKFGAEYTRNNIFNLFGRDQFGVYTFNSIDAFRNGLPTNYESRAAVDGNVNSIAADWTLENYAFFLQDTWAVNYNLTLVGGVRVDIPKVSDQIPANPLVQELYGLSNTGTIDGNELIQPRLGFNYTFDSDRPTQLRGGVGLFQGAAANVWLSNPFSNTGQNFFVFSDFGGNSFADRAACEAGTQGPGQICFTPDPDNQPATPGSPRQAIDIVDPSLRQPSVWKANLAFEHELPWWGTVAGIEAIVTRTNEGIYYERLDLGDPTLQGQDGRVLFWNAAGYNPDSWAENGNLISGSGAANRTNRDPRIDTVTYARPTSKGGGEQLTLSLTKPQTENWFWQLAYTYTRATEVNPLTSSQATSNWNSRQHFQANEETAGRTNYEIRDRFSAAVSYGREFFGNNRTEFAMFYEGRSGKPYSWTFRNDINGDGIANNDLFYVPAGPGDVIFRTAAQEQAFFAFLAENPGLARFAGRVVDPNSERGSWVNQFDIRITQQLPGFFSGHRSELYLDILNVGNLINKDWGQISEIGFPLSRRVANFQGIDEDTGRYIYSFDPNQVDSEIIRDNTGESRWAAQVGFRYRF